MSQKLGPDWRTKENLRSVDCSHWAAGLRNFWGGEQTWWRDVCRRTSKTGVLKVRTREHACSGSTLYGKGNVSWVMEPPCLPSSTKHRLFTRRSPLFLVQQFPPSSSLVLTLRMPVLLVNSYTNEMQWKHLANELIWNSHTSTRHRGWLGPSMTRGRTARH